MVEIGEAEGEGRAASVRVLGTMTFENLPPSNGDGAVEITVGFTLRSEGVLKVEAREAGTKTVKEMVIGHE